MQTILQSDVRRIHSFILTGLIEHTKIWNIAKYSGSLQVTLNIIADTVLMSVYEICFKGDICFSNLLSLRSTGLVPLDLFQQSFNNKDLKIIMLN